jgi:hypothetical protein
MEVEMATEQKSSKAEPSTHPLFDRLGPLAAGAEFFVYSVKVVCGKQTETNCCCVAGTRPGVYATEVNIQNPNFKPAIVGKAFLPLINSGAVVAREPNIALVDTTKTEGVTLPPLGATMDDCCNVAKFAWPPSGDSGLTIAILTIVCQLELSVSAVYTATPLSGDGISMDVEYIPSQRMVFGDPG